MSGLVYQAVNAVTAELAVGGIPKRRHNEEHGYAYRGIEDVLQALAPLLARHKLCVLPRVIDRQSVRATDASNQLVVVKVAFDLVSAIDGSAHIVESFGEAIDESDKGTAKAISAAYKSAMLQAFCIPVPQDEADSKSPRLNGVGVPEPAEGWDGWTGEVIHIVESCGSSEAIDRLCHARRSALTALQRSRPELYAKIGEAIAAAVADVHQPTPKPRTKSVAEKRNKGAVNAAREAAAAT